MNEIKQKEKKTSKHTTINRIYLYIPSANLENWKITAVLIPYYIGVGGTPYRAKSGSVCPNSELF
jgi:hypothetical protein